MNPSVSVPINVRDDHGHVAGSEVINVMLSVIYKYMLLVTSSVTFGITFVMFDLTFVCYIRRKSVTLFYIVASLCRHVLRNLSGVLRITLYYYCGN